MSSSGKVGRVSNLLAQIGGHGSFATRATAVADDLLLQIKGVGRIRLPVSKAAALRLRAVARPARHGYKQETRLDPRVRDTWEIPRSRISIDARGWKKTLAPQLERIRRELGLGDTCRLKAKLHNLLLYEPGQFFRAHQDSEKADDMIGTLVVMLPSRSTGGTMVVQHHDERKSFSGASDRLTFVAFYTDCYHEVRPVREGYRLALTYNLILEGEGIAASPMKQVDALAGAVRAHFATRRAPRWKGDAEREPPDRLVYLLDHEYTQRGLGWKRLKNADSARAATLRAVAERLDCEIFLALADVHETWACEEEEFGYGRDLYRGRGRFYTFYADDDGEGEQEDEDDEDDQGFGSDVDGSPELIELIDSDIELRHALDADGKAATLSGSVDDDELCYTKASVDFEPFESEHEGFTGNAGNTVDRWYHRAAVVLWPRERTFIIQAKASARWGIGEVARALRAGRREEGDRLAARLLPFWERSARQESAQGMLDKTLQVSAKLESADTGAALLEPFTLHRLTTKAAPALIELVDRHGVAWCRARFEQWATEPRYQPHGDRGAWLATTLPRLCRALAGSSPQALELARWLVAEQWAWIVEEAREIRENGGSRAMIEALGQLGKPILGVLESSLAVQERKLSSEIVHTLTASGEDYPLSVLTRLLRSAADRYGGKELRSAGLKPVHAHCVRELAARMKAPARSRDDWSIAASIRCSCDLCKKLDRFLRSSEQQLDWPLAKEQRRHIHGIVEYNDLPVSHQTRRTGRPFTLVLEKTNELFRRDAAEQRGWRDDLDWLRRMAHAF